MLALKLRVEGDQNNSINMSGSAHKLLYVSIT